MYNDACVNINKVKYTNTLNILKFKLHSEVREPVCARRSAQEVRLGQREARMDKEACQWCGEGLQPVSGLLVPEEVMLGL